MSWHGAAYQQAVQALMAEKQKANGLTRARSPERREAEIIDLMAALKASLVPAPVAGKAPGKRRPTRAAAERAAPAPKLTKAPTARKRKTPAA